jgi:hypothetical protein
MYENINEALENHYGDNHMEAVFHSQLKRRTQLVREPLQEFATAIDHLPHRVHVQLPDHLISTEAACPFVYRIREDIRWYLLLRGKKMLSEALIQALELEAADRAAGMPSRVCHTTVSRRSR